MHARIKILHISIYAVFLPILQIFIQKCALDASILSEYTENKRGKQTMKKWMTIFLASVLTLCLCAAAAAETAAQTGMADDSVYDENYVGDMTVVNCDEWVSLRSAADTSSTRLAKVPLGAGVTGCVISTEDSRFVSCYYNGQLGYILREYLASGPAEEFESVYIGDMTVVNCESWVSLRNAASSSSPRIVKVPLGATVTDCMTVSESFIYCRYAGLPGYIMTKYLSADGAAAPVMSHSELMNFGRGVLEYIHDGYTVISRLDYQDGGEILKTVCYGPDGSAVWHYDTLTENCTELDMTAAFAAGTAEKPMIMIHNAEIGLAALDLYTGEKLWLLPDHEVSLGASISFAVDANGTMYIGGFYGPDPVAIDMGGAVLWQAAPDFGPYWMHEIEVTEEGVVATYDCLHEHEQEGRICYNLADGSILWQD